MTHLLKNVFKKRLDAIVGVVALNWRRVAEIYFREMQFPTAQDAIDIIADVTGENRTTIDYAKTLVDKLAMHDVRVYQLMQTLQLILPTYLADIQKAFSTEQRVRDADIRASLEANSSTNASQPAEDSREDFSWAHVAAMGSAVSAATTTAENNPSNNGVVYNGNGAAHFNSTTPGVVSQTTTSSSSGLDMLATTAIGPVARQAETKVAALPTPVASVAPQKELLQPPIVNALGIPKTSQKIVVRKIPAMLMDRFKRETKLSRLPPESLDRLCAVFEPHWRQLVSVLNFDFSQVIRDSMSDRLAAQIVIYTACEYGFTLAELNTDKMLAKLSLEKQQDLTNDISISETFIDLDRRQNVKKRKPNDLVDEDNEDDDKLHGQEKHPKTQ